MSNAPQLFKIDPSEKNAEAVAEIEFSTAGFQEHRDIQEWIAAHPAVLGEELLIIAKEFSGFDRTSERADLVAVDTDGKVVVIELKRDDTGANVHWQAVKYASYFQYANIDDIVAMLATHANITRDEAVNRLKEHLDADDLETLNRDQRIILASHRFAPEVTSAVVWLNEKTPGGNLITCVQLTPYRESDSDPVFLQVATILPVSRKEDFAIRVGSDQTAIRSASGGGSVRFDEVTRFLREAAKVAADGLADGLRPTKKSRWAGVAPHSRYYKMWYPFTPWLHGVMAYEILLLNERPSQTYKVIAWFRCDKKDQIKRSEDSKEWFSEKDLITLKQRLETLEVVEDQWMEDTDTWLRFGATRTAEALDTSFKDAVASTLRTLIESVTPVVDKIVQEKNDQEG